MFALCVCCSSFAHIVETKCSFKYSKTWNHLHFGGRNDSHKENSIVNIINDALIKMHKCEVKI